ncbi:AAA family ATPase [Chitinimonas sp. BJB300]|uniref:AAA family ATPase n=1 Tax=Chitinimonas sp. BJB300 TaxID=1559339 RepID=UPI000C101768|nr:ATP-binding protein [Chitinimonas sp. BJB300]PHV09555.1 nicotinamide mononucleotide-binding protein [Chitinimonas sp. BJB300]TSJ85612.1 ATP-binding protein [Chitinimonas sp. BJB300]
MRKLAVVGAESSGKTTLARDLATVLDAPWLGEYARSYFAIKGTTSYWVEDVVAIAQGQRAGEFDPNRWHGQGSGAWLVCDTNALVCKIWAEVRFGYCPTAIDATWPAQDYALHILPTPDIAWEADPLRENPHDRQALFARYQSALQAAGAAYCVVSGSPNERVSMVIHYLENIASRPG